MSDIILQRSRINPFQKSLLFVANSDSETSLLSGLRQMLRSWWNSDRVRIAGSEGRSLTIQPGNRLLIHSQCFTVLNRTVTERDNAAASIRVVYQIRDEATEDVNSPADVLEVVLSADEANVQQLLFKRGAEENEITEADVTLL